MLSECGVQVTENCTYIRNPGFPEASTDITTCKFTVQKCDSGLYFNIIKISNNGSFLKYLCFQFLGVCALRLDFEAFTILGPADTVETGGGACVDSFVASAVSKVILYN